MVGYSFFVLSMVETVFMVFINTIKETMMSSDGVGNNLACQKLNGVVEIRVKFFQNVSNAGKSMIDAPAPRFQTISRII